MAKDKENKMQTTETAPTAVAGKSKLPKIEKRVFTSLADCDVAKAAGEKLGHSDSVRRFRVTGGGKTVYVISYSPAQAAGEAYADVGVTVETLDASTRAILTPEKALAAMSKMSDADRKAILDGLKAQTKGK